MSITAGAHIIEKYWKTLECDGFWIFTPLFLIWFVSYIILFLVMVIFNTWISKFLRTEQFYELVQGGCSTSRSPYLHSRLRGASFLGMFFSWWKAEIEKDTVFLKGRCTERAHSLPPSFHWPKQVPWPAWCHWVSDVYFVQSGAVARLEESKSFKWTIQYTKILNDHLAGY